MSRVLPIFFNTEMVRAILDGRKTVTRRLVMPHNRKKAKELGYQQGNGLWIDPSADNGDKEGHIKDYSISPCWSSYSWYIDKYAPCKKGDILYVRETWCNANKDGTAPDYYYFADTYICEDYRAEEWKWRPSIHMPKEAARIWLKVTDVRVERLQEITIDGCEEEGCWCAHNGDIFAFMALWDATIRKADIKRYGWAANPWVWVIEFERCGKPEAGEGTPRLEGWIEQLQKEDEECT